MITKYKRRTINQKAELHDKEWVDAQDVEQLIEKVFDAAIKAGADKDKLMELVSNG